MFQKPINWYHEHKEEIHRKTRYYTRDFVPAMTTLAFLFSGMLFAVSYPVAAVGGLLIILLIFLTGNMAGK